MLQKSTEKAQNAAKSAGALDGGGERGAFVVVGFGCSVAAVVVVVVVMVGGLSQYGAYARQVSGKESLHESDSEKQHDTVEHLPAHSSSLFPSHISPRFSGGSCIRKRLLPDCYRIIGKKETGSKQCIQIAHQISIR